ncbi:26S proteasome regulatory subunit N12 [Angomonas deanei]|uniref:CSN8/PSMD8/EIF3K family, putative n=1 Tax=Angomonas deanei TaxID=59799 RepID=A0A7G2C9T8_9TRYP|nr:26S proteasome regulatory subunit N12 [Angomonas deanei]CAD2216319.1 CSN8/PSMD8/EIF3K family, putative [Angomonas deanei]|eukprot:EPY34029.1 26S proteasome regulatory subunit N12 [Angomonas deanei]
MSTSSVNVRKVAEEYQRLKASYDGNKDDASVEILNGIKRYIIFFPTFLNPSAQSETRMEELTLTRNILELAVLVSARQKDVDRFELYFNQLQLYYTDVSDLEESPIYLKILGLNLVRLLVLSKIAQFHSELERIPYDIHGSNIDIRFAVLLERYLMEGSYNKLLTSRKKVPSSEYVPLVEMLEDTVRHEVAECIPHSYTQLSVEAAQKILMMSSPEHVLQIGRDYKWQLSSDNKKFIFDRDEDKAKKEIPFTDIIREHITYANDLQNVI